MSDTEEPSEAPVEHRAYLPFSDEDITHAARQMAMGRGYCAWGDDVLMSFWFVNLMTPGDIPAEAVGMFADYDQWPPGPMGINGMPMFMGGRFVDHDDAEKIMEKYDAAMAALEGL